MLERCAQMTTRATTTMGATEMSGKPQMAHWMGSDAAAQTEPRLT